jgi:uncharacterized membrane protein YhaH (DUF805 family)
MYWYLAVLKKYGDFSGRARRKEYWMFVLFNLIFSITALILDNFLVNAFQLEYGIIYILYTLAVLIPGLAVLVRRLHDVGKSGWMVLILLIPIIGVIWLLILVIQDSIQGENKYGPNPKDVIPPQLTEDTTILKSDEEQIICHSCGSQIELGHKFCKNCGNTVTAVGYQQAKSETINNLPAKSSNKYAIVVVLLICILVGIIYLASVINNSGKVAQKPSDSGITNNIQETLKDNKNAYVPTNEETESSHAVADEDVPVITQYDLVMKNYDVYKGKKVILAPCSTITLTDGEVSTPTPEYCIPLLAGLKFSNMINDTTVAYHVLGMSMMFLISGEYEHIGYLAVELPKNFDTHVYSTGPLSIERKWYVEVIGESSFELDTGGSVVSPVIKFLSYVEENAVDDNDDVRADNLGDSPQQDKGILAGTEREAEFIETNEAQGISNDEIESFAENFINAMNSTNIDELLLLYSNFVQFHGKNYSLQEVRLDKESYYKRWPYVNFVIDGPIEIISKDTKVQFEIPVRFIVENKDRNKAVSGTAIEQLTISESEGKWKIIAESEKMIEQRTFSNNESRAREDTGKSDGGANYNKNEAVISKEKIATNEKELEYKTEPQSEANTQFNKTVNYYIAFLNGLDYNQRISTCNQTNLGDLNDFEKAAFKRACELAGYYQAKPAATPQPNYPQRQPQQDPVDVNTVLEIIDGVIRKVN